MLLLKAQSYSFYVGKICGISSLLRIIVFVFQVILKATHTQYVYVKVRTFME